MASGVKRLLVTIGEREVSVRFPGSTFKELLEAIKKEVPPDCLSSNQDISGLEIFGVDWDTLAPENVSTIESDSRLRVVLKMVPFCSGPPPSCKTPQDGKACREGAAGAYLTKGKIWKDRQKLIVYFLNDEFIDDHKSGPDPLTLTTIMAWAQVWNSPGYGNIPELVMEKRKNKLRTADIRVRFSDDEGCWSMVGMDAQTVKDLNEPTMVLSLRQYSPSTQRSLVIHEFGHALGLEHEHQRSDFWDVVGEYFDQKKMMAHPRVARGSQSATRAGFERDWFVRPPKSKDVLPFEYDPESIMHYTFNVDWLKGDLRYPGKLDSVKDLSDKAREYLHAIHEQSGIGHQLPKKPSEKDLKALNKAYAKAYANEKRMSYLNPRRAKFSRRMNSDEFVDWLHNRGLGEMDRKKFKENGFTGESFLLLDDETLKVMELKMAGRMLIKKLLEEAMATPEDGGDPPSVPSGSPASDVRLIGQLRFPSVTVSNDLSNDLGDVGSNTRNPIRLNSSTSTEDNFREEETPVYCTTGPYEGASVFSFDHTIQMYRDKVWAGRQVLRVHFLNPEVATRWGLTTDTILKWAADWRQQDCEKIPLLQEASTSRNADIRVKFSETEGCWSAVGMDAEKIVTQDEPTMMLNLKGLTRKFQKSLVIHEFGHAYGLDHEHQWSDFLDVVGKFFDESKISKSQKIRVKKRDDMLDREETYDRHSIMHYWFDPQWLKPAYQDAEDFKRLNELTKTEKKYLAGLHRRQRYAMLPEFPSNCDFKQLHMAYMYKNPGPKEENHEPRKMLDVPIRRASSLSSTEDVTVILNSNYHLRAIGNAVWEARAKWREIGKELGFTKHDLDTLDGDAGANLESVLVVWMRRGNATIDQLLAVLRSDGVCRPDLAVKIERTRNSTKREKLGLL